MSILKVNTIQDKGGNTIISSDGSGTITPSFGTGKIGQIQVDNYVGSISNSGSTFVDVQTLTVTPEAQNSKYLVRLNGGYTYSVSDKYMAVRVLVNENSGGFNAIKTANNKDVATSHGTNSSYLTAPHSWEFFYTPSNTSSLTSIVFKTQFASINTSGAVQYNAGAFFSSSLEGTCVLSCMEVLA
jgi:hypothetical protein